MIIALAVLAGVSGLLIGGALQPAALRAIDESSPPLVTRDDVPTLFGRTPQGRTPSAVAIRMSTALLMVGVVLVVGVRWVLPAYLVFVLVTVLLPLTDIDAKLIPNRVTICINMAFRKCLKRHF